MTDTMEEKLESKQEAEELKNIFPNYNEIVTLREGEKGLKCKLFGHKRIVHHSFFTKNTERGKEYYECHVCVRCKDVEGKLVNIVK